MVLGNADSIIEVGQQFAWLGAALRSSTFDAGVTRCTPVVQRSRQGDTEEIPGILSQDSSVEVLIPIEFKMSEHESNTNDNGQCWYSMFRNPVLVKGYPILANREHHSGIQMSLDMIAQLLGTEQAFMFDSKVFIKGFSSMAIATKRTEDTILWHHLFNNKGHRISYLDHNLHVPNDINLFHLKAARHIVGWSSQSEHLAGQFS
jgi:hypothetical protein